MCNNIMLHFYAKHLKCISNGGIVPVATKCRYVRISVHLFHVVCICQLLAVNTCTLCVYRTHYTHS